MIREFIFFFMIILLLNGCGSEGKSSIENPDDKIGVLSSKIDDIGLEILNNYRELAGLSSFSINSILTNVAQTHAEYLVNHNLYTHYQAEKTPLQRIREAGYMHDDISENIYAGNVSQNRSIDILFSNIYHRLSFLDFGFDEIGLGFSESDSYIYKRVYTYEIGRENQREFNENQNPKVVIWPYRDQKNVMPVFYEELPDPLPECSVSGYPISLQFNPAKSGKIKVDSFKLYDDSGEIKDAKLLSNNQYLSDKEYVLMPISRLKWGTTYHVDVVYHEGKDVSKLKWDFTTKELPKPNLIVQNKKQSFTVDSKKGYYIYLPPKNCNDLFKSYRYRYTAGIRVDEEMLDNNTIKIKADGRGVINIEFDNNKSVTLYVE